MDPKIDRAHELESAAVPGCGRGALAVVVPIVLGVVFITLAVVAGFTLYNAGADVRYPTFPSTGLEGLSGGGPIWTIALLVFFVLVALLVLLVLCCCCGCKKGAGFGAFGLLLAPFLCPMIELLRTIADALDNAGKLLTGINEDTGIGKFISDAGNKIAAASTELRDHVQVPQSGAPSTGGLFTYVMKLPNLDLPEPKVLTSDFPGNSWVSPNGITQMVTDLQNTGTALGSAGADLTKLGSQLNEAATALRKIIDLLTVIVPCDQWTKFGAIPKPRSHDLA